MAFGAGNQRATESPAGLAPRQGVLALAASKGIDWLAERGRARSGEAEAPARGGPVLDGVLTALAVAPQAVSALAPSLALDLWAPVSLPTLYKLYKLRPVLDAVGLAALGALVVRARRGHGNARALAAATQATTLLRATGGLLSTPAAMAPGGEPHLALSPRELNRLLKPDVPVLGVHLNGAARCYPLALFERAHLVHDTVGGVPIAVTYSEYAESALAFRDEWKGRRLRLAYVGAPGGNAVFYEGGLDGMFHQLAAVLGAGPHAGTPLTVYPVMRTNWRHWKALHPATDGLGFEGDAPHAHGPARVVRTWLQRFDANMAEPLFPVPGGLDQRLPPKEDVLGLVIHGDARAFTRTFLRAHPVINAVVGGEPIVIFYDAAKNLAAAYSRRHRGEVMSFRLARAGAEIAEDERHGYLWNIAGTAPDGETLTPVPLCVDGVRWFAWAQFYPETRLEGTAKAITLVPPVSSPRPR